MPPVCDQAPLATKGSGQLPQLAVFHVYCHTSKLGGSKAVHKSMGGEQLEVPYLDPSRILPYVSLPLADFNYFFPPAINHNHRVQHISVTFVSSSHELLNARVLFREPPCPPDQQLVSEMKAILWELFPRCCNLTNCG